MPNNSGRIVRIRDVVVGQWAEWLSHGEEPEGPTLLSTPAASVVGRAMLELIQRVDYLLATPNLETHTKHRIVEVALEQMGVWLFG
jgi:hypothetical protein